MIRKISIIICLLGTIILSLYIYHTYFATKIVYLDIPKVFKSFEMQKELKDKYSLVEASRKRILDSLAFNLQLLSRKLMDNKNDKELNKEFDIRREDYFKTKNQLEQDNAALSSQYDKQILEQMTQYILDYGKKNRYDFIMGADGNGVLMYSKKEYDRSEEIITFINNKYKGIE